MLGSVGRECWIRESSTEGKTWALHQRECGQFPGLEDSVFLKIRTHTFPHFQDTQAKE